MRSSHVCFQRGRGTPPCPVQREQGLLCVLAAVGTGGGLPSPLGVRGSLPGIYPSILFHEILLRDLCPSPNWTVCFSTVIFRAPSSS